MTLTRRASFASAHEGELGGSIAAAAAADLAAAVAAAARAVTATRAEKQRAARDRARRGIFLFAPSAHEPSAIGAMNFQPRLYTSQSCLLVVKVGGVVVVVVVVVVYCRFEINGGQAIFGHWGGMFARS